MRQQRGRDMGPPEKERPQRSANRQGPNQESATTTDETKVTAQSRLCRHNAGGRHAGDVWREGFAYGFRDALRLAQREVDDPHMWLILSRLADRYGHLGVLAGEPHAVTGSDTR